MDSMDSILDELIDYWEILTYQLKETSPYRLGIVNSQLSEQELKVISFLGKEGEARMTDIANHMNLVGSSLTAIADKLIEKGCVERRRSRSDRRRVMLFLTDEGVLIFDSLRSMKKKKGKEILSLLTEEEKRIYLDLMKKMAERSKRDDF